MGTKKDSKFIKKILNCEKGIIKNFDADSPIGIKLILNVKLKQRKLSLSRVELVNGIVDYLGTQWFLLWAYKNAN